MQPPAVSDRSPAIAPPTPTVRNEALPIAPGSALLGRKIFTAQRLLDSLIIGVVFLAAFSSQFVRQLALTDGPLKEYAAQTLAYTDSPDYQWLTVSCFAVYFLCLIALFFRVQPFKAPSSWTCYLPELLLLLFVARAAVAYAWNYQTAFLLSDFLTLLVGITLARATALARCWRKNRGDSMSLLSSLLPTALLLLTLAALFHPDMGRSFKYRERERWIGPFYNPNTFGLLMGASVLLAAGGLLPAFRKWKERKPTLAPQLFRMLCYSSAGLIGAAALVKSASRGAWLGTAAGLAYLGYMALARSSRPDPTSQPARVPSPVVSLPRRWTRFAPAAIILFCALTTLGFWHLRHTEQPVIRRIFSVGNLNDFSWRNRVTAQVAALQMLWDRPLTGFGWNRVEDSYVADYRIPEQSESAAIVLNDYSVLALSLGAPALACFLGYIGLRFAAGHRAHFQASHAKLSDAWDRAVCRAAFIVFLVGISVERGIFYIAIGAPFWIFLECGTALPETKLDLVAAPQPSRLRLFLRQRAGPRPRHSDGSDAGGPSAPKRKIRRLALAAAVLIAAALGLYLFPTHRATEPSDPRYREILRTFSAAQPAAVNQSPDGRYVVQKADEGTGFRVSILSHETGSQLVSTFSEFTQRALTWRPDGRLLIYQNSIGLDRPLFTLDIQSGQTKAVGAPISQTALPPLRWSPNGTTLAYFQGDWRAGRLLALDLARPQAPVVLATPVSAECDFNWSPDGTRLALVSKDEPGIIRFISPDGSRALRVAAGTGTRIGELAWSPGGDSLLVTARDQQDEFFKLAELELKTARVSVLAQTAGDIQNPFWIDADRVLYHVLSNGLARAMLARRSDPQGRVVGPTDGVLRVSHLSADRTKAFARYASLITPPALIEIDLATGDSKLVYSPSNSAKLRCPPPDFVQFQSADGLLIPGYHWTSVSHRAPKSALILVHGGLNTQTFPTWEAHLKVLLDHGCDVLAVNYRGSSGYGQRFENAEGEFERVQDVLAARDYAVRTLNIIPGRVYLSGISHGSGLVATAAAQGVELGGLILVSWVGPAVRADPQFKQPLRVIELHGGLDPTMSPKAARKSIGSYFASLEADSTPQFLLFPDEGHFFYQMASWARVYYEAVKLIQGE